MSQRKKGITGVPVNVITGFLGVGKTTAILQLLRNKPGHERWAVLVNEFGEVGVDGGLFTGQYAEEQGVYVREVPGGCMCCAAGLPMQIALNQLLARAKPDRLLIEPTGLGHPKEVLEVLSSDVYASILSLQKTITLVDARKLSDDRYIDHATLNQQIALADVVVGNKQDTYGEGDEKQLRAYVKKHASAHVQLAFAQRGVFDPELLQGAAGFAKPAPQCGHTYDHDHGNHAPQESAPMIGDAPLPSSGFLKAENKGEGYQSAGWRFSAEKVFNRRQLVALFGGLNVERMKAVFITQDGIFGYNLSEDTLTEVPLEDCPDSRIELIARDLGACIESQLLGCVVSDRRH